MFYILENFIFYQLFTLFLMISKCQASNKLRDIIQINFLLITGINKKYSLIAYWESSLVRELRGLNLRVWRMFDSMILKLW